MTITCETAGRRIGLAGAVALFILVHTHAVWGASSGKIAGRVTDSSTGQPLPGANVVVEGTTLGAAADENGEYYILNVGPGWYEVRAQVIGYTIARVLEVRVQSDITTVVNVELAPTIIEGEEVVVVAERPIVELGVGNTKSILSGDAMRDLPQLQFKDVLSRQAGMEVLDARGLIVRGGREHELSVALDGIETRDAIDNNVYLRVNPDAVQEVEIQLGGFGAQYGRARAGVINVTTKEGGDEYAFTLDLRGSIPAVKHFGERWYERDRRLRLSEDAIQNPIMADPRVVWNNTPDRITGEPRYDTLDAEVMAPYGAPQWDSWETIAANVDPEDPIYGGFYNRPYLCQKLYEWRTRPEVTEYGNNSDLNANATLGGPVPLLPNTYFFASGRFERSYYMIRAPQNYFQDWGMSLKITSNLTPKLKLNLMGKYMETSGVNRTDAAIGGVASGINGLEDINPTKVESRSIIESPEAFGWFIRTRANDLFHNEIWPYSELSVSTRIRRNLGLNLTYVLSANTFWDISLDYGNYDIAGRYDTHKRDTTKTVTLYDPADPSYSVTLTGPYAMAPAGYYRDEHLWGGAAGDADYLEAITGVRLAGSYHNYEDSKATTIHFNSNITSQVNKNHQLNAGVDFTAMHITKYEYRNYDIPDRHWWEWEVSPKEGAFWVQDKMEYGGMVAALGLRADLSFEDEWYDVKDHPFQAYLSQSWMRLSPGIDDREYYVEPEDPRIQPIMKRPKPRIKWAPRLAVSHPISDKAKIFFNYGHYYQLPDPEKRYYFVRREETRNASIHRLGNPFMDYERTVQYEVGYSQSILDAYSITITSYYRDISSLARPIDVRGDTDSSFVIFEATEHLPADTISYSRVRYDTWSNSASEDIRGLEIRVEKSLGRYFTAAINAAVEFYSTGRYGDATIYQEPPRNPNIFQSPPVKPSARPRINITAGFQSPRGFGPGFLGMYPLGDIRLSLLVWMTDQLKVSYNPIAGIPQEFRAFQNVKWRALHATNLRLTKRFSGLSERMTPVLYVLVDNVFNTRNMFRGAIMSASTVQTNYLNSLKLDEGDRPGDYKKDYFYLPDPEPFYLFLNPRQIFVGIRLEM
ncbi:MAG: carboxypeptidase-like regulatory domain-containing protein [Fidelibacterota bacterium]|nr:MAG: carboxypeptidase-like regulatory domain-containing protein [Candidatus Neomarinimicrobiota bacterium]